MVIDHPDTEQLLEEVRRLRARVAVLEATEPLRQRIQEETAAELRRERNLARQYLNIAGVILVVLDRQGRIGLLNRRGHQILGYREGELVGKDWFETCVPGRARDAVRSAFQRIMAGEPEPFGSYENPVLTRSGEERTIAWSNTLLTGEDGARVGTLSSGEDITDRKRAEEALRRSHGDLERRVAERTAELGRANEQLRREVAVRADVESALRHEQRILTQLLESSDHDRMLVAYEIHDGLAQTLAGAKMELEAARYFQAAKPQEAAAALQRAAELLDQSVREARRLISDLRPLEIDEAGVVAAVEQLTAETAALGGPAVEFHHAIRSGRLPHLVENTLIRATQEGLTNARRHSQSPRVRVDLVEQEGRVHLEVRDWGRGFDPKEIQEGSFGLEGIRQRARLVGGQARIDSAPGEGTRITVDLPLAHAGPE